jgi:hypothetical protein
VVLQRLADNLALPPGWLGLDCDDCTLRLIADIGLGTQRA